MAVVAVMLTSVVIAACGDDDDDDATSSVVGTWVGVDDDDDTLTVIVNANGTGTYTSVDQRRSSGRAPKTETGAFTWQMQGADRGIIMTPRNSYYYGEGAMEIDYFIVNGNTMSIYDDGYNDDLDWVLVKQ